MPSKTRGGGGGGEMNLIFFKEGPMPSMTRGGGGGGGGTTGNGLCPDDDDTCPTLLLRRGDLESDSVVISLRKGETLRKRHIVAFLRRGDLSCAGLVTRPLLSIQHLLAYAMTAFEATVRDMTCRGHTAVVAGASHAAMLSLGDELSESSSELGEVSKKIPSSLRMGLLLSAPPPFGSALAGARTSESSSEPSETS